jgi:hypothetical protein
LQDLETAGHLVLGLLPLVLGDQHAQLRVQEQLPAALA